MADGWRHIDTAPRDGTPVDLWVVDKYLRPNAKDHRVDKGERITNAMWGEFRYMHGNGHEPKTGWYFDEGIYSHEIERLLSGGERYATHWMPLPAPPDTKD